MRFSKVSFLIQMPHIDSKIVARDEKGSDLTEAEAQELDNRIEYARRWLETYADESTKFAFQPDMPDTALTDGQKVYLAQVAQQLKDCEWHGEVIHGLLHEIKSQSNITPKEAFEAIYKIFLGKSDGPQAGWFLSALDKELVLHRLDQAAKTQGDSYA